MPLITTEVIIGKGKHTVTMMDIGEEVLQNDLPPGKGAADYEMLANQYPDSPLFSEGPFNSAKSYAEYYMMSVFGRGNDSSALQNFNPRSNPDFAGTSVDLSLRHASSADTNELVPEMYDDFKTNAGNQVISLTPDNVEDIGSMPLTSYYPNTASPSTTIGSAQLGLPNGLADEQGPTAGPISVQDVPTRHVKQFGVGNGSYEKPDESTLEIASRISVVEV